MSDKKELDAEKNSVSELENTHVKEDMDGNFLPGGYGALDETDQLDERKGEGQETGMSELSALLDKPEKREKGRSMKIGIIGGQGSGKTAYLYTLGLLKARQNDRLNEWQIGRFSDEYTDFFGVVDSETFKRDWQRTSHFDSLRGFKIFSMSKGKIKIDLEAFEAAGENFEMAIFHPRLKERIEGGMKDEIVREIIALRKEILSCDGFIFLIDGEYSDPEYVDVTKSANVHNRELSIERLLLHFTNLLEREFEIPTGKKINKPIVFVLTKADIAKDSNDRLKGFSSLKKGQKKDIKSEQLQSEAEEYIEDYFPDIANIANRYFENRSFYAISCWGQDPVYYLSRPSEPIQRNEIKKIRGVKVWVKDIRPICIEEPLVKVLEEVKQQRGYVKKTKRKKIFKVIALVAIAFAVYPLLSFLTGRGLEHFDHPKEASFAYDIAENHPFSRPIAIQMLLVERYLSLVDDFLQNEQYADAYSEFIKTKKLLINIDDEKERTTIYRDDALKLCLDLSDGFLKTKDFNKVYNCLTFAVTLSTDDFNLNQRKASTVLHYSSSLSKMGNWEKANELLAPLFNDVANSRKVSEALFANISRKTGKSIVESSTFLLKKKQYASALKQLHFAFQNRNRLFLQGKNLKQKIVHCYVGLANISFSQHDTRNAIQFLEKASHWVSFKSEYRIIAQSVNAYLSALALSDRLVFLEHVPSSLRKTIEFRRLEGNTVFDIANYNLSHGKPKEVLRLLKTREWLSSDSRYKKYRSHATKASKMVFINGGASVSGFYVDRYEVTNREYKTVLHNNKDLTPSWWETVEYKRYSPYDESPVIYVSYNQAEAYARNIGKRLVTVQEWEKIWGNQPYPWGHSFVKQNCNTRENEIGRSLVVRSPTNMKDKSSYGVYGLAGNVAEITHDTILDNQGKLWNVVKGGCYMFKGSVLRKQDKRNILANINLPEIGFRCAMDLLPR